MSQLEIKGNVPAKIKKAVAAFFKKYSEWELEAGCLLRTCDDGAAAELIFEDSYLWSFLNDSRCYALQEDFFKLAVGTGFCMERRNSCVSAFYVD